MAKNRLTLFTMGFTILVFSSGTAPIIASLHSCFNEITKLPNMI